MTRVTSTNASFGWYPHHMAFACPLIGLLVLSGACADASKGEAILLTNLPWSACCPCFLWPDHTGRKIRWNWSSVQPWPPRTKYSHWDRTRFPRGSACQCNLHLETGVSHPEFGTCVAVREQLKNIKKDILTILLEINYTFILQV